MRECDETKTESTAAHKGSVERLRLFIDHAPAALAMFDREMRYLYANRRWMSNFGLGDRDLRGVSHYEVFPELPERWKTVHRRAMAGEVVSAEADRFDRADGTVQWLRWEVRPWYEASGALGGIVIFSEDITERMLAVEALRRSETILKQAGQMANLGAWVIEVSNCGDIPANPLTWSDQVYRIFGYEPGQVEPTNELFFERVHPEDRRRVREAVAQAIAQRQPYSIEHRIIRPEGAERIVWEQAEITYDDRGCPVRIVGAVQDITERKRAEATIEYQAYHDLLTGLPNRAQLMLRLELESAQARHTGKELAVLHLDLDRFRAINDALGHAAGDRLILAVTARLKALIREHDTLARAGSDEFIILYPDLSRAEEAALFARKLLEAMRKPFRVDGRELYATASIGISICPEDSQSPEILLKNADIAVSYAKKRGRNTAQFFNPTLNRRTVERLLLENNLRRTIERGELVLYYQPQVNIRTGEVVCFEALVRWKHAELGLLGPTQFIPVAEEIGFITTIDEWVLRTACGQNRAWQDSGRPPLCISVNLSAEQFQQPELVELVAAIVRETGMDPRHLGIEVTESTAMRDIDLAIPNLRGLHAMGISLSIDDFGTGYSSLSYLKRFPIHRLKIDQSFIRGIAGDPDDQAIVNAVIAMGRSLNLKVIAEGVETEEQLSFLRAHECDEMQGFLYSRPVPAEEVGATAAREVNEP